MSERRFFPRPAIEATFNRWDWALLPLVLALFTLLAKTVLEWRFAGELAATSRRH